MDKFKMEELLEIINNLIKENTKDYQENMKNTNYVTSYTYQKKGFIKGLQTIKEIIEFNKDKKIVERK